jgi:hypothetical protein
MGMARVLTFESSETHAKKHNSVKECMGSGKQGDIAVRWKGRSKIRCISLSWRQKSDNSTSRGAHHNCHS